ncbi:MAG: hypothetical protein JRJ21_04540 [Deltaproteobacteria bacterium]|nr:hypothetical protein [Deltaproteobacteria bacterium]
MTDKKDSGANLTLGPYRQFYLTYPEIWQALSAKSRRGLLPKLISGELYVSDAEKFVEEAGV